MCTIPLVERKTLNSECFLSEIFGEIRKSFSITTKRAQITAFLTCQNVKLIGHPAYSPDLVPKDFKSGNSCMRLVYTISTAIKYEILNIQINSNISLTKYRSVQDNSRFPPNNKYVYVQIRIF